MGAATAFIMSRLSFCGRVGALKAELNDPRANIVLRGTNASIEVHSTANSDNLTANRAIAFLLSQTSKPTDRGPQQVQPSPYQVIYNKRVDTVEYTSFSRRFVPWLSLDSYFWNTVHSSKSSKSRWKPPQKMIPRSLLLPRLLVSVLEHAASQRRSCTRYRPSCVAFPRDIVIVLMTSR